MDRTKRLFRLRREGQAFAAALADETLDRPVPSCPAWTVRDLALHLGRVWNWAGAATRSTQRPPRPALDFPRDAAGLSDALLTELALLLDALEGDPAAPAWSFAPGHGTLGFWQRRQLLETALHRWDAARAFGEDAALDPEIALDGLTELAEVLVPLRHSQGKLAAGAMVAVADDGGAWVWGEGEPTAEVAGSASDLLLLAWGRLDADAPGLRWSGDAEAGRAFVAAGLTP